jgi:predicted nucleic acid-binding Zn ribbon protein
MLTTLFACATCQPDQNTDTARAANFAILFMVIIVFLMLGTLLKIMFNLARRQRQQETLP